jgi:hypothetical protein
VISKLIGWGADRAEASPARRALTEYRVVGVYDHPVLPLAARAGIPRGQFDTTYLDRVVAERQGASFMSVGGRGTRALIAVAWRPGFGHTWPARTPAPTGGGGGEPQGRKGSDDRLQMLRVRGRRIADVVRVKSAAEPGLGGSLDGHDWWSSARVIDGTACEVDCRTTDLGSLLVDQGRAWMAVTEQAGGNGFQSPNRITAK